MISPAFPSSNVPIVFATDQSYALYFSVCLQSLFVHSNDTVNYDLLVFEEGLSKHTKENLLSIIQTKQNFSLRFFSLKEEMQKYNERTFYSQSHFSRAMYFRLFIPALLKKYTKVIYLDIDIILLADIAELFSTDITKFCIAGYIEPTQRTRLFISDYINSGVLVMNLEQINKTDLLNKVVGILKKYQHLSCPDQDVLNMLFSGKICPLSVSWNFCWHFSLQDFKRTSDFYEAEKIIKKIKIPKLIHYTSGEKPWNYPEKEFACLWWEYAQQLSFYSEIKNKAAQDQLEWLKKQYDNYLEFQKTIYYWLYRRWNDLRKYDFPFLHPSYFFKNK